MANVNVNPPDFLRFDRDELHRLFTQCDALATHVYVLLKTQAEPSTGMVVVTTYARLIVQSTPPRPARGPARPGPTYSTMRRAVEQLVDAGLVKRDAAHNVMNGQLVLAVRPRP